MSKSLNKFKISLKPIKFNSFHCFSTSTFQYKSLNNLISLKQYKIDSILKKEEKNVNKNFNYFDDTQLLAYFNSSNRYNDIALLKYYDYKFSDNNELLLIDYLNEIKENKIHVKADKEAIIYILNEIVNDNLNSLNNNNKVLSIKEVIKINEIFGDLNYLNYTALSKLEELFKFEALKTNDFDMDNFVNLLKIFELNDFKTNDENFGEFFSKFFMISIPKMNYTLLSTCIKFFGNLKYAKLFAWEILEFEFFTKFNKLYNPHSLEKIAFGFSKNKFIKKENNVIFDLIENFIENNFVSKTKNAFIKTNQVKHKRQYTFTSAIVIGQRKRKIESENSENNDIFADFTYDALIGSKDVLKKEELIRFIYSIFYWSKYSEKELSDLTLILNSKFISLLNEKADLTCNNTNDSNLLKSNSDSNIKNITKIKLNEKDL